MRSGYLGGIFGRFGALRGAPGMMDDGWVMYHPGGGLGRINQGDRYQMIVLLFTYENGG